MKLFFCSKKFIFMNFLRKICVCVLIYNNNKKNAQSCLPHVVIKVFSSQKIKNIYFIKYIILFIKYINFL